MPRGRPKKVQEQIVGQAEPHISRDRIIPRLKGLSDLIGWFNDDAIHACFGSSQVGKTTFWLQILYDISDQMGKPVLFYDTEGGAREFVEHWDKVFRKDYPNAKVDVRTKRNIKKILYDHGMVVSIKHTGGKAVSIGAQEKTSGKMGVQRVNDMEVSPMDTLIKENKYGAIFYDSVTMPMKYFGAEQQNFPARNTAQTAWFDKMIDLIDDHKIYVIASHHASKNPAIPYSVEQMSGGSAVNYYCKIILHLKKKAARGATAYRTLTLMRYFNKPPSEYTSLFKLTENGYGDATKEQMDADKEAAKTAKK